MMKVPAEIKKVRQIRERYNAIPTMLWSALAFIPVGYFCYVHVERFWMYSFLLLSLGVLLLPVYFLQRLQFSRKMRIYQRVGVRTIKKLTQDGDLVNQQLKKRFPDHRNFEPATSAPKVISKSWFNEKIHWGMLLFFLLLSVYAIAHRLYVWAMALTILNALFNLLPIFLQQYNRLRIQRIQKLRRPG